MTTTDANGIIFLEETDAISPFHTLINALQQGTSDAISAGVRIVKVANTTERAAAVSANTPSTSSPVFVWRTDAGEGRQLEYTVNGTTWYTVHGVSSASINLTVASDYRTLAGGYHSGRLRFDGDVVRMDQGRIQRSTSAVTMTAGTKYQIASIDTVAYRPLVEQVFASTLHYTSGTPVPCEVIFSADGIVDVRPYATGALSTSAADWIAIPNGFWPRS